MFDRELQDLRQAASRTSLRHVATLVGLALVALLWFIASTHVEAAMLTPPTQMEAAAAPPTDAAWVAPPGDADSADNPDGGCARAPAAKPRGADISD